jgi:hypothetical protein
MAGKVGEASSVLRKPANCSLSCFEKTGVPPLKPQSFTFVVNLPESHLRKKKTNKQWIIPTRKACLKE